MSYTFFFTNLLLALPLLLVCFATLAFGAAQLPDDEVQALKDIAKTLRKTNWNFSADPCVPDYGWANPNAKEGFEDAVTCNCTLVPNSTVCHVTSIVLKAQNLQVKLPPELSRLPFLQEIDLTRNYLNGTIPPEWGALPLVKISLLGNRLTGSLPVELANITTLKSLHLEINSLSGVLPVKLGNLPNIEIMILSSNNFTGELPETFAGLSTLKDFRISDNSFSGRIPNFIQNWTNLNTLEIQASGLTGPVPSGISLLTNLTDMIVTDLIGPASSFPSLKNLVKLKTLMLRNCNITGQLPEYLGTIKTLKTLDISFNKLTGEIPSSFSGLANADYMFLTGNMLTGSVPDWMNSKGKSIDLSYNNFTTNSGASCTPRADLNLFASSSGGNTSSISCSEIAKCSKTSYSLYINCGADEVQLSVNFTRPTKVTYEDDDTDKSGPSSFYKSSTNWAISNTGYFHDDASSTDTYILKNLSILPIKTNPQLYLNARVSPISLTYYGFCLGNGIYTVNLHFAEISFTNDKTYSSLGRRIFDIYIQGLLALKDFNIASDAGGFGIAVVKKFTANVTSNTLEIRLLWAGKGTTSIPQNGPYGPLISAISVYPSKFNFEPPPEASTGGEGGISVGVVIGIVASGIFIILLIFNTLWWKGFLRRERTLEQDLDGADLQTSRFTWRQIKAATNEFDPANKIGEGGFGPVHKGLLSDGTIIAVKQLSAKSKQGNREFVNEIGMISALVHPHLVKLYGCCIEGNQLLLVYEYMKNNSLARALFGPEENQLKLDWRTRHNICVGIARGLAFLHEESRLKIVHRDIKATNVLLDKNLCPKISDFGLAKLDEEDNTHISTRIAGTYGYMAPEYAMHGYLTDKADVYSFGIVVLEIVSGRSNTTYRTKGECFILLDWARVLKEEGNILDLVDPRLGSDFNKEEMMRTINVAFLCTNVIAAYRPTMSSVVSMLEGKASVKKLAIDSNASKDEINKMRKHFESNVAENMSENSQRQTMTTLSTEGPWTASSSSVNDLYPLVPDSSYWENRNERKYVRGCLQ
ncbi:probable leucine-rich repeat receptor-like serine/threonine-protein kinase At3g14840 [Argentina anserina]|uniref:probable leucine-rich repeat receptor-like serine/threonine-protein kinase At3g14840 n=1 Tax=Argentina anserina TaxID=57926 RepID=UPI0021765FDD|nr:probable leucine-rich repeat receptor-like serine/threonine-protein kinase At3g14840 [Potentilla anserina]